MPITNDDSGQKFLFDVGTWLNIRMAVLGPTQHKPSVKTNIQAVSNLLDMDNVQLHVSNQGIRYLVFEYKRSQQAWDATADWTVGIHATDMCNVASVLELGVLLESDHKLSAEF